MRPVGRKEQAINLKIFTRPIVHTPTQIFQNTLADFSWHKQTSIQFSQCLVCR